MNPNLKLDPVVSTHTVTRDDHVCSVSRIELILVENMPWMGNSPKRATRM